MAKYRSSIPMRPIRISVFLVFTLLFGLAISAALIFAAIIGTKMLLVFLAALVLLILALSVPDHEKYVLYAAIISMPIGLDFHPIYFGNLAYQIPMKGLRISLFDLLFFYLFFRWIFRLMTNRESNYKLHYSITLPFAIILLFSITSTRDLPFPFLLKFSLLIHLVKNWMIFIYFANNVQDKKHAIVIIAAFIFSGFLQSFTGLLQYISGSNLGLEFLGATEKSYFGMKAGGAVVGRVAGTFGHPNKLALYISGFVPWCVALFFAPIRTTYKLLITPVAIIISAACTLTLSRGGWINFGLGSVMTLFFCLNKKIKNVILSGVSILAAVIMICTIVIVAIPPVRDRLFKSDHGSAYVRIPLASLALHMIKENPITGVGIGGFTVKSQRYDTTNEWVSSAFVAPVHNEFLLIASEVGLIALGCFLIILALMFYRFYRLTETDDEIFSFLSIGLFFSLIGTVVHLQFEYLYAIIAGYPLWILLGLVYAITNRTESRYLET